MAGPLQEPVPSATAPALSVLTSGDGRILDPIDRVSEILFGLFMVMTFTGTLSAATAGREDVRTMLIAAIGCNIAWGFVDAVMYILRTLVTRARGATLFAAARQSTQSDQTQRAIANHMGPLAAALDATTLERVRRWLIEQPAHASPKPTMTGHDVKAAIGIFLLVFASTFPVVLPFFFTTDVKLAMRVSAAIAMVMMFYCGIVWGRYAGVRRPWVAGLALVVLGMVVELIIIALGG